MPSQPGTCPWCLSNGSVTPTPDPSTSGATSACSTARGCSPARWPVSCSRASGADVLRVGAEHLPSVPVGVISTGFGKRNAFVDLRTDAGRASMDALLRDTGVWIDAFRPGAMAALGYTPERAAAMPTGRRGRADLGVRRSGPWAGRRGFDSIVQSTTGVRWAGGEVRARRRRADRASIGPTGLPVQALDYATGFLAAGVAAQLLAHQRDVGGSWSRRSRCSGRGTGWSVWADRHRSGRPPSGRHRTARHGRVRVRACDRRSSLRGHVAAPTPSARNVSAGVARPDDRRLTEPVSRACRSGFRTRNPRAASPSDTAWAWARSLVSTVSSTSLDRGVDGDVEPPMDHLDDVAAQLADRGGDRTEAARAVVQLDPEGREPPAADESAQASPTRVGAGRCCRP